MERAYDTHADILVNVMGRKNAYYLQRSLMHDPDFDIENEVLRQNKVIVMSLAPRHRSLGISLSDSDTHSVLIAHELFANYAGRETTEEGDITRIGFAKRVDDIYIPGTPYNWFRTKRNPHDWDSEGLRKSNIRPLGRPVTAEEMLRRRTTEGYKLSLEEKELAGGKTDQHLCEDSALAYLMERAQQGHSTEITLSHAYPTEMYRDGIHIIKDSRKPLGTIIEWHKRNLRNAIEGKMPPHIVAYKSPAI